MREAYSNPVNSSFFLLPLSSVPPTLSFHCSYSHFLPVVCRCSPAADDTFVHPASLLPLPPWLSLSCIPLHPMCLCSFRCIPVSLPAISSLCFRSHSCSLDQYSVPSSGPSGSPPLNPSPSSGWAGLLVLCIHLKPAKFWNERVKVGSCVQ